jgi:hypothetical protein
LFEPSDDEIVDELVTQSYEFFDDIGLGGIVGSSMEQFDRERPDHWPMARTLLGRFGLTKKMEGWWRFLEVFGFVPPTPSDIQASSHRRRNPPSKEKFTIPHEDDYYPTLTGKYVGDVVQESPVSDGWAIRTTLSIVSLR